MYATPMTVPGAPVIGDASAGNGSATVRWSAPAGTSGSGITSYEVLVFNADTNARVGALHSAGPRATSMVVRGLTNGTRYRFQVRALNDVGTSDFSNLSNVARPSEAPGQPVIGTASAGNHSATVRWHRPASNGGAPLTGYVVTALRIGGNGAVVSQNESRLLAPDSRSTVLRLPRGTYRFIVVARNASGDSRPSARSNRVRLG